MAEQHVILFCRTCEPLCKTELGLLMCVLWLVVVKEDFTVTW
jgi:hypothetical protein